ncbi:MAG TPA: hypothetical protein PLC12_06345, partial [Candidatus Methanofastidiosa archaeon]|nr:hypothetical protein [Candidatus Methanofastidiosa archaeon]
MKRTLVLIILLVPLCACIGDGNDSAPSISDRYPTEDELYLTPYEEVSFFIEASDPDGDYEEIRWYVDDEFIQYGNDFTYSFEDEKEYEIRAVVDDGKFNTASVWKAEVEIDIEQIMEEISSLRGLEFTGNVPFRRISREDLNTMLEEEFASMEDGLLIDEKVMRAFYVWNGDSLADEVLLLY